MTQKATEPHSRDSVFNAIGTLPANIPVKHFMLVAVLDGIRSRIGIPASLKLPDAPGGSIKEGPITGAVKFSCQTPTSYPALQE